MYIYIILISLLILFLYLETKQLSSLSHIYCKGYDKDDDINTRLDRIWWSNNYRQRLSLIPRVYILSFIVALAIGLIYYNRLPSGTILLFSIIPTFVILLFGSNYFYYHSDIFSTYAINKNIVDLKDKLGLSVPKNVSDPKDRIRQSHSTTSDLRLTHPDMNYFNSRYM